MPTTPEEGVRVTGVVSGDTFDVLFPDGTTDRVRLLGVDVPGTLQEGAVGEYGDVADAGCLADWGDRATEFARDNLAGREVTLVMDPAAGEGGGLSAYLEVDGRDFGGILVEQGLARAYVEGASSREKDYLASESMVRTSGTGLWSC